MIFTCLEQVKPWVRSWGATQPDPHSHPVPMHNLEPTPTVKIPRVCQRCNLSMGTGRYEDRWVCDVCRGILEWRALWSHLQISPGFLD